MRARPSEDRRSERSRSERHRRERWSRGRRGRVLLLLAALPVLLCGPALGGVAAWIHSHGLEGVHVHLLPDEHDHDHDHEVAALGAWHDAQHRRGHGDGGHDEDGPAPEGLRIELRELVATSPRSSTAILQASAQAPELAPPFRTPLALFESCTDPGHIRSAWPPQGTERSGVAALLRSSHAILI